MNYANKDFKIFLLLSLDQTNTKIVTQHFKDFLATNDFLDSKDFAVYMLQLTNRMFFVKISVTRLLYCETEFVYTSWQSYFTFSQIFWHFMKKGAKF